MPTKRIVSVTIRFEVEGDAEDSAILNCLGCDVEDAIERYATGEDTGLGLADEGDVLRWEVLDPVMSA